MTNIIACIDGSTSAPSVCDYAAWASQQLGAPLVLLHVLDRALYPQSSDLSGNIGWDSQEQLLDELARLDEKRARLAREQAEQMLDAARQRVQDAGYPEPETLERHGNLVETLLEQENDMRLLVIGKRGEDSTKPNQVIGSQLESAIRRMRRPVLVTPTAFRIPRSVLLAFDGSPTADKGIDMICNSELLRGMPIHLVMVSANTDAHQKQLAAAAERLVDSGYEVHTALLAGEVEDALLAYQQEHQLGLLAMGAYGHSRIREFFIGSTTTTMLRRCTTPLLMLR
ncbi:MAG: universal stress protein [Pseudomonas sp.]